MAISGAQSTFWQLIESSAGIEIPRIQRDYVQGRKDKKVERSLNKLLQDIKLALDGGNIDLNYVYGVIQDDMFVPVDGQQRLTTLLCLHMYAFARDGKSKEIGDLGAKFVYKTRLSTGRFLQGIATHLGEYFATDMSKTITEFVKDSHWYMPSWDNDPSTDSLLSVLDKIRVNFAEVNPLADILLDSNLCPITFMRLQVEEMGNPDVQYVRMNSRGKQLTDFENFKSELFDLVGNTDPNARLFKGKVDGDWMNMIWKKCQSCSSSETPFDPKWCDKLYMVLLHNAIVNSVELHALDTRNDDTQKAYKDIIDNDKRDFYNFDDYKIFIDIDDWVVLKDVYYTMECLCFLLDNASDVFYKLAFLPVNEDWQLKMGLALYVFTKYATDLDRSKWTADSFKKWYRVTTNIIKNVDRGPDAMKTAKNKFAKFPARCLDDVYDYLDKNGSSLKSAVNNDRQISEEILKCQLICANPDWEKELVRAESHGYFMSEINFALKLLGIDDGNIKYDAATVATFSTNWDIIKDIFGANELNVERWVSLRRTLLSFDDFSYTSHNFSDSAWVNRLLNYYCKDHDQHANSDWRGLLRNFYRNNDNPSYDGYGVFKRLFDAFVVSGKTYDDFYNDMVDSYAHTRTTFTTNHDELNYYLVTDNRMFEFFKDDSSYGRIWEYGKEQFFLLPKQIKVSGIHYKLYALHDKSMKLEYHNFKSSNEMEDNYVTFNGHDIRYDTTNDCYTVDGNAQLNGGATIKWVSDMLAYMKSLPVV